MIDIVRGDELRRLSQIRDRHCVSLFLPTHPTGADTDEDQIRLKNLVSEAAQELDQLGMRAREVSSLLAGIERRRDDAAWWAQMGEGLAVFARPAQTWTFRLGEPVEALAVVADRFHLGPLVPTVASAQGFYLLALSENRVRLLRGHRSGASEVSQASIPSSLAETTRQVDREPQLQSHSADRVGPGTVAAAFHGHGGTDRRDADRTRFLRAVDDGLAEIIGASTEPLVLAGVADIVARFRNLSGYRHIAATDVVGNPDHLGDAELHERGWEVVAPELDQPQEAALEAIATRDRSVATAADEVLEAARRGRVGTLVLADGRHRWARMHGEDAQTPVHPQREPGDVDLWDQAAMRTWREGGRVFVVEPSRLPLDEPVAAILRY